MGTFGMNFSLPSRDLIADCIETVMSGQWYDGLVSIMGCDKNLPGAVIAMGRLNRPSQLVYGGSIHSGWHTEKKIHVLSTFEPSGARKAGLMEAEELTQIIRHSCQCAVACEGMYPAKQQSSSFQEI